MILAVCLDEQDGMSFFGRRLSIDRVLWEDIGHRAEVLWMNAYSARKFSRQVRVSEDFLVLAEPGQWCFAENTDIAPCAHRVEKLYVYRWNRHYPSDLKFPWACFSGWQCIQKQEFAGNSHDMISLEVYVP